MDQEQKRRESLYYRFRKAVEKGFSLSEFDENDLIDIYDYANDNLDEDVQMQVLFAAARYFPNDDELLQRRAFFLLDNLSMANGAMTTASLRHEDNALWELLALRINRPSGQQAADQLSAILNRYEDYDDETIIQIVATFADLDMLDWLKDHKDLIQKRCLYPDTFLYELAGEVQERGDYATAIRLLDELTEMAPFNATYWHMLSQQYINADDYDNALSAIDYAVAIDPESSPILTTKAQILYDTKKDPQEAYRLMREVVERDSDYGQALFTLCAMLAIDGKEEEAAMLLERRLEAIPDDADTISYLLKLGDSLRNLRVLRKYLPASRLSQEDWAAWGRQFYDSGQWQAAADVLLTWLYANGECSDWNILIESLYRQHRIGEIAQLYSEYLVKVDDPQSVNISFTSYLLLLLALLRSGQMAIAANMARYLMEVDVSIIDSIEQRAQLIGAQTVVRSLIDSLDGDDPLDIDAVDPFYTTTDGSAANSDVHDIVGDNL